MSRTALELSKKALKEYHPMEAILSRRVLLKDELVRHREKALIAAKLAASILRSKYGAEKIFLFGSLARQDSFTLSSDIDLSVEGIPPERFYDAVGCLISLISDFKIDLIDRGGCSKSFLSSIESEGIPM